MLLPAINLTCFRSDNSENKRKGLAPDHVLQGLQFLKGMFHGVGNRCGHDPKHPRFRMLTDPHKEDMAHDDYGHKRKQSWFYQASEIVQELYFYPKMFKAFTYHQNILGQPVRLIRSEAREAESIVVVALIHHVNLASVNPDEDDSEYIRIGRPTKEGFTYYSNNYWLKVTGLSPERLSNAFVSLTKKGVIERKRRYDERDDGKIRAMATSTTLSKHFLGQLGLLDGVIELQAYAYDQLKKKAAEQLQSTASMLSCAKPSAKPDHKPNREKADEFPPEDFRHWEYKLHQSKRRQFKELSTEIYMEAQKEGGISPKEAYKRAYKAIIRR